MIAELGLAKLIAAGGGMVSGIALLAGMTGGAQHAAVSAQPDQRAAAVCSYVPDGTVRRDHQPKIVSKVGLSREQAANAQAIVDVATDLNLPRRAAVIGIATALQESDLKDGVVGDNGQAHGIFQQHPQHGWGTHAQVTDPNYAARTFYKRLIKVGKWDTRPLTEAAQAVQRSAFPDAYAKHEPHAEKIVAALTMTPEASSTSRPTSPKDGRPITGDDPPRLTSHDRATISDSIEAAASLGIPREAVVDDLAATLRRAAPQAEGEGLDSGDHKHQAEQLVTSLTKKLCAKLSALATKTKDLPGEIVRDVATITGRALKAVTAALDQRGVKYSWGGGGPSGPSYGIGRGASTKGFDCSGLTEYAWAKAGLGIGGTTYEQVKSGSHIPRSQVKAGDLVFYETNSGIPGPDHVGLAINNKEMVNAPHTGAVVRVDSIDRNGYSTAIRPN
ncbi:C40 family peptidase [Nonomuraea recticatena]|uniref:NlpC/P60 domain-containing protein n=1 Tax=Nonomuraea recticatena TaxID=46178 RepID=A0ABP6DWW6_9ACTN